MDLKKDLYQSTLILEFQNSEGKDSLSFHKGKKKFQNSGKESSRHLMSQ